MYCSFFTQGQDKAENRQHACNMDLRGILEKIRALGGK
jgi:hypothetical protein